MVGSGIRHWTIANPFLSACLASLLLFTGCGGGASFSPPPTTSVAVSIAPSNTVLPPGGTQQFTASVTGSANTSVTWQVNGVTGGSSAVGTITSAGWYTAPAVIPASGTLMVSAVSQADATQSARATVMVSLPVLSGINPTVVTAGSPGLNLTASGSLFTKSSQVLFNGSPRPTVFVSASQLTASISASDIAQASPPTGFPVAVETGSIITASLRLSVVTRSGGPTMFSVTAGNVTNLGAVPLTPPPGNPSTPLSLAAVGVGNSAGVAGGEVRQGTSATLLLAGDGIAPGTSYAVTGPSDVSVAQPQAGNFGTCTTGGAGGTAGTPCVSVNILVGATATLGPRNIIVTNQAGELTAFVGGLLITQ